MNKLDSLRLTRSPSSTSAHSQVTSGASSPNATANKANPLEKAGLDGKPVLDLGVALGGGKSIPGTPHFGAQTELLKTLDESTKVIRQNANIPSRASSVSGIGAIGTCISLTVWGSSDTLQWRSQTTQRQRSLLRW